MEMWRERDGPRGRDKVERESVVSTRESEGLWDARREGPGPGRIGAWDERDIKVLEGGEGGR